MEDKVDPSFENARGWAGEQLRAQRRGSKAAWIVASIACVVAIVEGFALAALIPLKEKVPIALLVDRHTGYVQQVDLGDPARLRADQALLQSLLAQYVTAREGYDNATVNSQYNKVALWSAGPAKEGYLTLMDASNPSSPVAQHRDERAVLTEVKSVSQISGDTALVRFDTTLVGNDNRNENLGSWIAYIEFEFVQANMSFDDQVTNPLGFQVTQYRRDAERPQPEARPSPQVGLGNREPQQ